MEEKKTAWQEAKTALIFLGGVIAIFTVLNLIKELPGEYQDPARYAVIAALACIPLWYLLSALNKVRKMGFRAFCAKVIDAVKTFFGALFALVGIVLAIVVIYYGAGFVRDFVSEHSTGVIIALLVIIILMLAGRR